MRPMFRTQSVNGEPRPCEWCPTMTRVTVNDLAFCSDHLDEGLAVVVRLEAARLHLPLDVAEQMIPDFIATVRRDLAKQS